MFNGKFMITLVAIIVAVLAICNLNTPVIENFWGNPTRVFKVSREVMDKNGNVQSIQNNYESILAGNKGSFFQIPGTFQSQLNPRFSNVDYGANIRYNLPSVNHMAVPSDPLSLGNMVKENYNGVATCGKGGSGTVPHQNNLMEADYADPSFHALRDKLHYTDVADVLPAGDMTTVNALGEVETPIVYDRFVFANQKSRLYGRGDPIRGDVPIAPCNTGWFQVSVHPHIDLRSGAMAVLGGVDNETSKELYKLQTEAVGGIPTPLGGVDMSVSKLSALGAAVNDLTVTGFP